MLKVHAKKKLAHFLLDVQFTVKDEIIVLFGPSGSGKTTILNMIAGLIHPDHGYITVNDTIFWQEGKKPLPVQKRKVGYLFQDYALFPHMTVEKNILYGVKEKGRKHTETTLTLMKELNIEHLLKKYPNQISGGEKQRVALTRALATEPNLLLLDEPFSALDHETRNLCHDQLLYLHDKWKIPIILVTHDLEEGKKLGNRIIFLEKGKIVTEKGDLQ